MNTPNPDKGEKPIRMTTRLLPRRGKRAPVRKVSEYNWDKEIHEQRDEFPEERKKRLAKQRSRELAALKTRLWKRACFDVFGELARAFKQGHPGPINVDFIWETENYSSTERWSFSEPFIQREVGKELENSTTHANSVVYGFEKGRHSRPKGTRPHLIVRNGEPKWV